MTKTHCAVSAQTRFTRNFISIITAFATLSSSIAIAQSIPTTDNRDNILVPSTPAMAQFGISIETTTLPGDAPYGSGPGIRFQAKPILPPGCTLNKPKGRFRAMWGSSVSLDSKKTERLLLTTGLLIALDKSLMGFADDHIQKKGWAKAVSGVTNELGSWSGLASLGGLYLAGGEKGKETAKLAFAAVTDTLIITTSSKFLFGRNRPKACGDKIVFDPLSNRSSMPSGHTGCAFAMATVLSHQYPKHKWLFYGLAASVGFARIQHDEHFPTDVFIGGTIGTYCGRRVIAGHDKILSWKF